MSEGSQQYTIRTAPEEELKKFLLVLLSISQRVTRNNRSCVDDVVGDILLNMVKKNEPMPDNPESYAYTAVIRKYVDLTRKASRYGDRLIKMAYGESTEYESSPLKRIIHDEEKTQLHHAISQLKPRQQQVILDVLNYKTVEQIACEMEIKEGTVKNQRYHATKKIITIIKKQNYS